MNILPQTAPGSVGIKERTQKRLDEVAGTKAHPYSQIQFKEKSNYFPLSGV